MIKDISKILSNPKTFAEIGFIIDSLVEPEMVYVTGGDQNSKEPQIFKYRITEKAIPEFKVPGIYIITDKNNNILYIGMATKINGRLRTHIIKLTGEFYTGGDRSAISDTKKFGLYRHDLKQQGIDLHTQIYENKIYIFPDSAFEEKAVTLNEQQVLKFSGKYKRGLLEDILKEHFISKGKCRLNEEYGNSNYGRDHTDTNLDDKIYDNLRPMSNKDFHKLLNFFK